MKKNILVCYRDGKVKHYENVKKFKVADYLIYVDGDVINQEQVETMGVIFNGK